MTTTANDIQVLRRIADRGGVGECEAHNGRGAEIRKTTVTRLHGMGLLERGPRPLTETAGCGYYVTVKGFQVLDAEEVK